MARPVQCRFPVNRCGTCFRTEILVLLHLNHPAWLSYVQRLLVAAPVEAAESDSGVLELRKEKGRAQQQSATIPDNTVYCTFLFTLYVQSSARPRCR